MGKSECMVKDRTLFVFSLGNFSQVEKYLKNLSDLPHRTYWIDPLGKFVPHDVLQLAGEITFVEAILGDKEGYVDLTKFSYPGLNTTSNETSALREIFPGLSVRETIEVPLVLGETLLPILMEHGHLLEVVIDCPGHEHTIVEFLETSGLLQKVDTLYLRAGVEPFFAGARAAGNLAQMLENRGLSAGEIYDDADPDWPVYRFKSDQRTRLVNDLRAQLDDLAQARDAAEKAAVELQDKLADTDEALAGKAQEIEICSKEIDRLTTELTARDEIVSENAQEAGLRDKEVQQLTKDRDAGQEKVAQLEEALKKLRNDNTVQQALSTEKTTRLIYEAQQLRLDLRRATAVQEALQSEKDILGSSNKAVEEENQRLRQLLQQLTPKLREAAEQVRKITSPPQASSILNKKSTKSPKTKAGDRDE